MPWKVALVFNLLAALPGGVRMGLTRNLVRGFNAFAERAEGSALRSDACEMKGSWHRLFQGDVPRAGTDRAVTIFGANVASAQTCNDPAMVQPDLGWNSSACTRRRNAALLGTTAIVAIAFSANLLFSAAALGAPKGGTVIAGGASIAASGNTTNIVSTTNRAIINWQGFSLSANEIANFMQPTTSHLRGPRSYRTVR
jgi:hypothetical protein